MEGALQEIRSCANVRDLGGYDTPRGLTPAHRFVRCGGTRALTEQDLGRFRAWGVTRVLDLRGNVESPRLTCRFANQDWVVWENVSLYDVDISSPDLIPAHSGDDYLVSSYLHMLSSPKALRQVFEFFAQATRDDCTLFHCAAGMDRTGMVAMLLLGLAGVSREQILADYCYSFGEREAVDPIVAAFVRTGMPSQDDFPSGRFSAYLLRVRLAAIATVYDTLLGTYGSVRAYLHACGITDEILDAAW